MLGRGREVKVCCWELEVEMTGKVQWGLTQVKPPVMWLKVLWLVQRNEGWGVRTPFLPSKNTASVPHLSQHLHPSVCLQSKVHLTLCEKACSAPLTCSSPQAHLWPIDAVDEHLLANACSKDQYCMGSVANGGQIDTFCRICTRSCCIWYTNKKLTLLLHLLTPSPDILWCYSCSPVRAKRIVWKT